VGVEEKLGVGLLDFCEKLSQVALVSLAHGFSHISHILVNFLG